MKKKTVIKSLTKAAQIKGHTYVSSANASIIKTDNGYRVTKHDYLMEAKTLKTFISAKKYMYR